VRGTTLIYMHRACTLMALNASKRCVTFNRSGDAEWDAVKISPTLLNSLYAMSFHKASLTLI